MESNQQQQQQMSQEEVNNYNKMKGEYQQIYKVYMDLDDEKKEHELVIEATKELESNRKCWRMIGGVLVERTLGEVLPALKQNIEMINKASAQYAMMMQNKEKDLINFELKYGLKSDKKIDKSDNIQENKSQGVLA